MNELDSNLRTRAEEILDYDGKLKGPPYLRSKLKRAIDLLVATPATPFATGFSALAGTVVFLNDGSWPFINLGLEKDEVLPADINWWKVRTMVKDARVKEMEYVGNKTLNEVKGKINDNRVTRVGKKIRTTHLDDAPLLFNVAKGEISVVGPRMFSTSEWRKDFVPNKGLEPYKGFVDLLNEGMKFGVTGMFIIMRNKECLSFKDRVWLDVLYGWRANLAADVKIIAMTLPQIRKPSG